MANKKTTSSKNKSSRFRRFSNFNPLHAFVLIAIFAMFGAITIYFTQAVGPWRALTNKYHCRIRVSTGVPDTIKQGDDGNCTKMVKFILKNYAGQSKLIVDKQFGPGMTPSVKNAQKLFGLTPNGIIGPKTWKVIEIIYKIGINPQSAPTSPPPPPNAYIGPKPGFSGKLTKGDTNYFNSEWPKWNTVGWCIIGHESHTAGEYNTANGDGAFQIIKSTWNNFYGYSKASSAPPDVQWVKYFYLYADGAGGHHWHGTYWANNIGHLIDAQGRDLGSHNVRPGAIPCPNT